MGSTQTRLPAPAARETFEGEELEAYDRAVQRLLTFYQGDPAGGKLAIATTGVTVDILKPEGRENGGGGLYATTSDYARFAQMLLDQFGGGNGELKAAMQYFVQAFGCRHAYPDKYDLLMDVATEEFSHLEIVGATITMLLNGINGAVKDAAAA